MSDSHPVSGPQFRAERVEEQEAVRTTIVGGRPPGSGQPVGPIPRGIEVLIKKASVDAEFRATLLARRAAAADEIGLRLDPAEAMMLAAAPAEQLEAIIDRTTVPQAHRRAFLGKAAVAMLAALGFSTAGCPGFVKGITPDVPPDWPEGGQEGAGDRGRASPERPDRMPATDGIAPDMPPERPTHEPAPAGDRPDMPPERPAVAEETPACGNEPGTSDPIIRGIRPDAPPPPPAPTGIRPDLPPERIPVDGGVRAGLPDDEW